MKSLKDCEYTAFISYAHADDEAWYGWVTCFRNELERGLRALLRGVPLPRLHLSGENGPVAGALSEELRKRVAASFAMIIVVHENYAQSSWCLKELEYFRSLSGDDDFRDRLYIVALSEAAMVRVSGSLDWQRLLPHGDQLWVPFYDPADKSRPLDIYMGPGLVATAFRAPFERLRSDFASKLRHAASGAAEAGVALPDAPREPLQGPGVTSLPSDATRVLFGFVPPGTSAKAASAAARLDGPGLSVCLLGTDIVFGDFADFEHGEHLVLAFDDTPPMMTTLAAGGHLELQRDAWLKKGKPPDRLHWLDLRADPAAAARQNSAAAFVAGLGATALDIDALAALLRPRQAAAAQPPPMAVRIYIESNRNERTLWESLGERIRRKWDEMAREGAPEQLPPLALRPRGLPVDQIDSFPNLDDADGVVLLWGRKTSDALVAQINKVENKMAPGRDAAPGIVAYLIPPQQASEPIPAWGWQVLRFDASDEKGIDVVDEERDELRHFLRKVLLRRQQRDRAGGG
jgi:hypothetical protein